MMNPRYLNVSSIGKHAQELLAHDQSAKVIGVTSKGAFLRLAEDHMIFIANEQYRGPLTLNVKGYPGWLDLCRPGDALAIEAGRMRFDPGTYGFDYLAAATWEAPEITTPALPHEERIAILEKVATRILTARAGTGFTSLLVSLFGPLDPSRVETTACDSASKGLQQLRQTLETGEIQAALAVAETFLGLGSGLTPSGDDLLLGLLLVLNRWGPRIEIQFDLRKFNQGILELAPRRTTTLSSSLLDCAANGQGDERLVAALDSLLTGQLSPDRCAAHLIAWGSSSGCDAFVGMALAVLTLSSFPSRSRDAH